MVNLIKYKKDKNRNLIYLMCPECNSKTFTYDYIHQEIICNNCNLILKDNALITLCERYAQGQKFQEYLKMIKKK